MLCLYDSVPKKWIPTLDNELDDPSNVYLCKYCSTSIERNRKLCENCSVNQNSCMVCDTKLIFDKASCLSFLQVLIWHLGRAKLKVDATIKKHYENQIEKIRLLIIDVNEDRITSYNDLGLCFWITD